MTFIHLECQSENLSINLVIVPYYIMNQLPSESPTPSQYPEHCSGPSPEVNRTHPCESGPVSLVSSTNGISLYAYHRSLLKALVLSSVYLPIEFTLTVKVTVSSMFKHVISSCRA